MANGDTVTTATATPAGTTTGESAYGETDLMSFPSDVELSKHYILFSSFEYSRANRRSAVARKGPYKSHIALPVPHNLQVGYGANYTNDGIGFMGMAMAEASKLAGDAFRVMGTDMTSDAKVGSIADLVKQGMGSLLKNAPGVVAGQVLDKFGDASQGLSLGTGVSKNPHLAVLYKNPNLRTHQFAYEFTPRSSQESTTLLDIIATFKSAMHPNYAAGFSNHLFKYPDEWQIEFGDPAFLFKFQPCVLTSFSVDYHGAGTPSYFESTGAPTVVTLSLQFMETVINTRTDIEGGM